MVTIYFFTGGIPHCYLADALHLLWVGQFQLEHALCKVYSNDWFQASCLTYHYVHKNQLPFWETVVSGSNFHFYLAFQIWLQRVFQSSFSVLPGCSTRQVSLSVTWLCPFLLPHQSELFAPAVQLPSSNTERGWWLHRLSSGAPIRCLRRSYYGPLEGDFLQPIQPRGLQWSDKMLGFH